MKREPTKSGPMSPQAAILQHVSLLDGLKPETRQRLEALADLRTYPKGATVVAQGDGLAFVGLVIQGVLRVEKLLSDGRQQIIALLTPTDMFGRVHAARSDYALEAATDVRLCCFERRGFEKLVSDHPDLEHAVLLSVLEELDAAREWVVLLAGTRVAARLANFLLILSRRWPKQHVTLNGDRNRLVITIPVDRTDLAHYLATTVESISRSVQEFVRDGLIQPHNHATFEILDLQGLIEVAGNDEFNSVELIKEIKRMLAAQEMP